MRKEIIQRQREAMADAGLDVLVAMSPENFAYTAGFVVPSQHLMRWRHAMAVVTGDEREVLLTVDMEESTVRSRTEGVEIRVWGEFTDRPMEVFARLLGDLGLAEAVVGIEMDYFPAGDFEELRGLLPKARFSAAQTPHHRVSVPNFHSLVVRMNIRTGNCFSREAIPRRYARNDGGTSSLRGTCDEEISIQAFHRQPISILHL